MVEENNDYDFCTIIIDQFENIDCEEEINNYTNEIIELNNQIKLLSYNNTESNIIFNCCFYFLFDKLDIEKYKYNIITINYLKEQRLQIENKITKLKLEYDMYYTD